jgi:hypothetical protein
VVPIVDVLTEDATKQLLDLCRTGKLYEIERWIDAGRSLRTPSKPKKTPLEVAVELGFHSLVELLARNGTDVAVKNKALSLAIEKKRFDLVQVLVGHGAEIKAVSLVDVFLTWEPSLIRYFLDTLVDRRPQHDFFNIFLPMIMAFSGSTKEWKKEQDKARERIWSSTG